MSEVVIGVDVSYRESNIALFKDNRFINKKIFTFYNENNFIKEFLSFIYNNNISINSIDGFLIGTGPGSFTSLRIISSFFIGFCSYSKSYLHGIPSALIIVKEIEKMNYKKGKFAVIFCGSKRYLIVCDIFLENGKYIFSQNNDLSIIYNNIDFINTINTGFYDKIIYLKNNMLDDWLLNINLNNLFIKLENFPIENILFFNKFDYIKNANETVYYNGFKYN